MRSEPITVSHASIPPSCCLTTGHSGPVVVSAFSEVQQTSSVISFSIVMVNAILQTMKKDRRYMKILAGELRAYILLPRMLLDAQLLQHWRRAALEKRIPLVIFRSLGIQSRRVARDTTLTNWAIPTAWPNCTTGNFGALLHYQPNLRMR
jgi:hypothetical protein